MPKPVRLLLLTTASFFIISFLFVFFTGISNNSYVLAACPEGYNSISYGPNQFCVNAEHPNPPCLPGDDETVIGQTLQCTRPEVPSEPPGPGDPPDTPTGPTGETCSMLVLFDPNPPIAGAHINIVTPKPDDGIITTGDKPSNYYFEIDSSTQNRWFSEADDVWTATFGPLEQGSHYLSFFKSVPGGAEIRCGQQTFTVEMGEGFPGADDTGLLSGRVQKVVNSLITFGIGIAGGVAFLLLIYGGFKFMFSFGNPENIQQGREIITSAIIGLLVVVFSVFLLRLIGISILGLPI